MWQSVLCHSRVCGSHWVGLRLVLCCHQAEKRKLLMEQETQKIKEVDEQYANELREWKAMLVPRKQVSA